MNQLTETLTKANSKILSNFNMIVSLVTNSSQSQERIKEKKIEKLFFSNIIQ